MSGVDAFTDDTHRGSVSSQFAFNGDLKSLTCS